MQGALRARLLGATAAGSRIYWLERPQGTALPAITLQTISGDRPQTYTALQAWRESRVQLDVWAASYAEARAILEAAITALAPLGTSNGIRFDRTDFEGERDRAEFDGNSQFATATIYRTGIDLIVRHAPA